MLIVIGIEIIEANHLMSVRQQPPRDVHADEAGRAGDENRLSQDTPFPAAGRCHRHIRTPRRCFALGWQCFVQYKTKNAKSFLPPERRPRNDRFMP
jgi:hypothetical protein